MPGCFVVSFKTKKKKKITIDFIIFDYNNNFARINNISIVSDYCWYIGINSKRLLLRYNTEAVAYRHKYKIFLMNGERNHQSPSPVSALDVGRAMMYTRRAVV